MPLPLWSYCCCGGEIANCCDWWSSCPVATPTNITVTWTYELVRYYSNGQRLVQAYETWTLTNANALTRKGINCLDPLGYDDGCTEANFTYESGQNYYAWNVLNDATLDGYTGTIVGAGSACSGCIFNGPGTTPICQKFVQACLSRTDKISGTTVVAGAALAPFTCVGARNDSDVLKYGCTNKCGCIAPFIQFRPAANSFTGQYESLMYCCNDDANIKPSPIAINFPKFTLVGNCGCPSPTSWSNPKEGCDCPNLASPFDACTVPCDCNAVNNITLITTGQDCWSWTCANYAPDPFNPIITACEVCLDYIEKCEQNVVVTVV